MATVEIEKKTKYGLGTSDTQNIKQSFPASPLNADYDPEAVMKAVCGIVDGNENQNPQIGPFNLDYEGAPVIEKYVPDPGSPGPGSINPTDKPAPPTNWPPPASGMGSQEQPINTSAATSKQKFGQLTLGSSK